MSTFKQYAGAEPPKRAGFQWTECEAQGCPLQASALINGNQVCTHHHGADINYWTRITEAIKANMDLITGFSKLTHRGAWTEKNLLAYQRWRGVPMGEKEPPSIWLNRVHSYINRKIAEEASQ